MKNITILAALLGLGCTSETMMIPEDIIGEAGATTEVPETGGTEATGGSGTGGNEPTGGNVETGGTEPTGGNDTTGGNVATGGDQTGGNGTGGATDPFAIFQESENNPNGVPFTCRIEWGKYLATISQDAYLHAAPSTQICEANLGNHNAALICENNNMYPSTEDVDEYGIAWFSVAGSSILLNCVNRSEMVSEPNTWCCSNVSEFINL
jgi:hypothetical protein